MRYEAYSYIISRENLDAQTTDTPDVRIDDADFEVLQIKVRAQLADVVGTALAGTPLLHTSGNATNSTMPSASLVKARINVNDRWLQSEKTPLELLGAYAPGDDGYLAVPFTIPKRAKVYAEMTNDHASEGFNVQIALIGRKVFPN
jgi:hypothetical protein